MAPRSRFSGGSLGASALSWLAVVAGGCATSRFEVRGAPERPFDVAIVPGCPSNSDGSVSLCQLARALAAAGLFERGYARHFIVSGAAVHGPFVEAEALAAAMAAAGVPADRIHLEPNALHTDENMYFSLQIARALGFRSVAVVSTRQHAAWGCRFLADWGQPCGAFAADLDEVKARHRALAGVLDRIRLPPVREWVPLAERERRIFRRTGRRRPPSFLLYPWLGILRMNGEVWVPAAPPEPPFVTWAERARTLFADRP